MNYKKPIQVLESINLSDIQEIFTPIINMYGLQEASFYFASQVK
jgi:hypothetical protein